MGLTPIRREALPLLFVIGLVGCSTMTHPHMMPSPWFSSTVPVHRWELPNGLTVLFQEDRQAPLVAMQAVVRTGSATEGAWAGTGISHVVEHMLFKGTATRPVGSIEREIKSYGGEINGHTSHDVTGYTVTVHRDHAAPAIALLSDALQNPSFDPAELTKELEVVFRELKLRRDDPEQFTADLVWSNRYRVHPYRFPIVGFESLLRSLTREDIVRYHRTHYLPNRTVLAIVGDVSQEAVQVAVEAAFGAWPRGVDPSGVTPVEPLPVAPRLVEETADVKLAQVVLAFPSVAIAHPDVVPLDTLAKVLGEGRGSRLDLALRESGLVHDVASWNYTPRDPGIFAVTLRLDPERIEEATARLWGVIQRVQEQPVTADELQAAKRSVIAQYLFGRQTVGSLAADLAIHEVLLGHAEFSRTYVERVQQVTAEDLQRVARQYVVRTAVTQVVVRPRGASAPSVKAAAGDSTQAPIEIHTLANGVRVLLRQDSRLPIVTLRVTGLGGLLYESPDTNGVSTLTARMLLRGTARWGAQELTALVRSLGGELASVSGRNSVGVSLSLLSQDVGKGLEVLSDVWHHPAFPADEFLKEQRLLTAEITHAEDDLFRWGTRRLYRALFPDHPYGMLPEGQLESVARLSVREVTEFHRLLMDPRRTVVSVFGDVQKAEALPLIERAFGQAPVESGVPPAVTAAAPLIRQNRTEDAWPRDEAVVLIGFRGAKVADPDAVVLDVLDMVLGGMGGRLYTEVRERKGQAYAVGSSVTHGLEPGSIVLYAVTSPQHTEEVIQALLEEVARLRDSLVTAEELAVAKQGLIGSQGIRLQTNGALSLHASLDELYGLGAQAYREYPAKVEAVTAEALRRVGERYLTPEACVIFAGRPRGSGVRRGREPIGARRRP